MGSAYGHLWRSPPAHPRGQAGPKWVGPSRAQVGGPKLGPNGWAQFGTQQILKIKILKIKIGVAQNVGKVWIGRKKIIMAPFGAVWAHFLRGLEKCKNAKTLSIFLGGPMGPIHPVWGLAAR